MHLKESTAIKQGFDLNMITFPFLTLANIGRMVLILTRKKKMV